MDVRGGEMRAVLIGPVYPFRGGIAHYTTFLYQQLCQRHTVLLLSFSRQYPRAFFPGRTDRDPSKQALRVEALRLLDPLNPITWYQAFMEIRDWKADLLVIQWWIPFWAPPFATLAGLSKRLADTPVLYICHNVVPHEAGVLDRALTKLALRQGDFFLVHSKRDHERLSTLVPRASINQSVLPTYEPLIQGSISPEEARQSLGIPKHVPVMLFFGFIRPYKGVDILLKALAIARRTLDVRLLLVGEFWEDKQPYLDLIRDLELSEAVLVVDRYVPNEELDLFFAASDVVVLPYKDTSQSAVVQLAFGAGKPVITTDVGGLAEIVEHGKTGHVVPPQDPDALADAMLEFFKQGKPSQLRDNVLQARERFSWMHIVDVIESIALKSKDTKPSGEKMCGQ